MENCLLALTSRSSLSALKQDEMPELSSKSYPYVHRHSQIIKLKVVMQDNATKLLWFWRKKNPKAVWYSSPQARGTITYFLW